MFLALLSPIFYARAIILGQAKPHRTTRLVILLSTLLTTASLFAQQNTVAIWIAGVSTIQACIVFALSYKYGMGGWAKIDIICLCIALLGLAFWKYTNNPLLALFAAIIADFTGMIPTLIKTYKFPNTESWPFFGIDTVAALFTIAAIQLWTIDQYSYPLYLLVINGLMVVLIIRLHLKNVLTNNRIQN